MPLELYLDLFSQPCRSVYIFAKKNNIPFDFKQITLLQGQHHGEEFGKINPLRKVPALRDGEFCLAESIAMMLYMVEKFKTPDYWYPADLQKRALVNEYLSWQHSGIRLHGSKVFLVKVMVPKIMGKDLPQAKRDDIIEELNNSLNTIEKKFLKDKPFIAGNQISLADLVAIAEIYQPYGGGVDVFEGRPKLSAWRDRVRQEIGPELFDEAHKVVMGASEFIKTIEDSKLQGFKPIIQKMFF